MYLRNVRKIVPVPILWTGRDSKGKPRGLCVWRLVFGVRVCTYAVHKCTEGKSEQ